MYILLIASFIGYWAFLGRRYPEVRALLPFIILSLLISLLYIAGLFGALALGRTAILYLGLFLLTIALYESAKSPRTVLRALLEPHVVLFTLVLLIGFIQLRHATLSDWDEFAWAAYTKEIVTFDALVGETGQSLLKHYPPGLMLVQYYLISYTEFSENIIYLAQFLVLIAALTIFLHRATWKSPLALISVLLSCYFVVQGIHEGGFVSILQDTSLSVFVAATIICYYILRSFRLEFLLIPTLFVIPIIKQMGIFFGLSVAAIIVLDQLILFFGEPGAIGRQRWFLVARVKSALQEIRLIPPRRVVVFCILLAAPLVSHEAWNVRLHIQNTPQSHYMTNLLTRKNIAKVFMTDTYGHSLEPVAKGQNAERLKLKRKVKQLRTIKQVKKVFFSALYSHPVNFVNANRPILSLEGFSLITWYWICAGIFLYLVLGAKGSLVRVRYGGLFAALSVLQVVYILIITMVYAVSFVPFSSLRLDSYERLMETYTGIFLLVGFGCVLVRSDELARRNLIPVGERGVILVLLVGLLILQPPRTGRLLHPQEKILVRKSMDLILAFVHKHVAVGQKVFLITQNSTGFSYWILRYELSPRATNLWYFSLGKRRCANDLWSHDLSAAGWAKRLVEEKFDFVLVARGDREFWERYGGLFKAGSRNGEYALYGVRSGPEGAVRLDPVAEVEQYGIGKMDEEMPYHRISAVCKE